MSESQRIEMLLPADPDDSGCDAAFAILDVFVEEELAGRDAGYHHPSVAAHLRACPACRDDYHGLLSAAGEPEDGDTSAPA
jgi:hypothetical protein